MPSCVAPRWGGHRGISGSGCRVTCRPVEHVRGAGGRPRTRGAAARRIAAGDVHGRGWLRQDQAGPPGRGARGAALPGRIVVGRAGIARRRCARDRTGGAHAWSETGETAAVADYFAGSTALLLLDNCEHIADSVAEFTTAVLRGTGLIHVLATSRHPLGVEGGDDLAGTVTGGPAAGRRPRHPGPVRRGAAVPGTRQASTPGRDADAGGGTRSAAARPHPAGAGTGRGPGRRRHG